MDKELIEMFRAAFPLFKDSDEKFINQLALDFIYFRPVETLYNAGYRKITPIKSFWNAEKHKHIIDGVEFTEEQIEVLSKFSDLQTNKVKEMAKTIFNDISLMTILADNGLVKIDCIKKLFKEEYGVEVE